jgi:signal transduction histidine kinase
MKKKLGTAELHHKPRLLLRTALIVAAYLLAFTGLDLITKQFEGIQGIVAWYPPAGLTYAFLLVFGARFTPAVTIALLLDSMFVYRMSQPPYLLLLWALILSLIYGLTAVFLRSKVRIDWQLRKLNDVTWFVFTTVIVSAFLAVLSVSSSALSSGIPRSEVLRSILQWWIGETVGVLTVTPFLLIYVMPALNRFMEGEPVRWRSLRSFPRLTAIGQVTSIALTLYWVFGAPVPDEFHPLFLIALPLIWIALQRGVKGASAAILALNSGVVIALSLFRFDLSQLGELELLMIFICIVGLLMGAVVTERKQAEEEIRQLNANLEQRVEERTLELFDAQERLVRQEKLTVLGQLAGGVSHELRNPLGVISNAIYYLKLVQPEADGKIRQYHDMIDQEVHNAEKIISELLDFARIKSADREVVSVPVLVQRTLARFPVPDAIKTTLNLPADLPMVFADPRQMEQVLGNLTLNACQAMPDGGYLTISAHVQNEMILIAVKDTGTGITPENMKKLFEPLFTTKPKGIGLGLTVSRKLAEANDGRIEVQSESGKGSTFTVYLPEAGG